MLGCSPLKHNVSGGDAFLVPVDWSRRRPGKILSWSEELLSLRMSKRSTASGSRASTLYLDTAALPLNWGRPLGLSEPQPHDWSDWRG